MALRFATLLLITSLAEGFEVLETESAISVRDSEGLEMTCTGSEPWDYCTWNFDGRRCSRTVDSSDAYCGIDPDSQILWKGVPSIDKRCTIFVARPDAERDSGRWSCSLITSDMRKAYRGFDVTVYTPTRIEFGAKPHKVMMVGSNYSIECSGIGGNPKPDLVSDCKNLMRDVFENLSHVVQ